MYGKETSVQNLFGINCLSYLMAIFFLISLMER